MLYHLKIVREVPRERSSTINSARCLKRSIVVYNRYLIFRIFRLCFSGFSLVFYCSANIRFNSIFNNNVCVLGIF